ncbi:MAG TPA: iron-containing alcohol dehydrogenase [Chloroflexota bacterium]
MAAPDPGGTFVYANPPEIHWGPGCAERPLAAALDRLRARRVFLVTTRSVAASPRLGGALRRLLGDRLVGEFGAVGQHAPASAVSSAAAAARAARPDALLSLGGGSPIDAAKAVALNLATGIDVAEPDALARAREATVERGALPPHLAVPTTLSAAELASGAGFTDEGSGEKLGLRVPALLPAAVFYDAALALETPLELWLSSGIRAVDHAVECLLAPASHPFADTLALEGLRRLRAGLLATRRDPTDLAARTESQLGAWFSYTLPGPTAAGLSHTLGKRLGSRHGIPHGLTSCLLLPHVMRYLAPRTAEPQSRIAAALGADPSRPGAAADAVAALIAQLALPRHLAAYNLTERDLDQAVAPVVDEHHSAGDLRAILQAAW